MDSRLRVQAIAYRVWRLTIDDGSSMEDRLNKIEKELHDLSAIIGWKGDPALERAPNLSISSYLIGQLLTPLSYQAYRTIATADGERLLRVGEISFTLIDDWASFDGPIWIREKPEGA